MANSESLVDVNPSPATAAYPSTYVAGGEPIPKVLRVQYLNATHRNNQVIVIENEHPPAAVDLAGRLKVFTRNPTEGRYGLFPPI